MSSATRSMAVLFAEVCGSALLYEQMGDTAALRGIAQCLNQLKKVTSESCGRVVRTIGDELVAAFPDADTALQAATDMQQRVNAGAQSNITIRIGFHCGPVIQDGNELIGDAVNIAARMAGIGRPGQIMTTAETVASLSPLQRASTRRIALFAGKSSGAEVELFEVLWREGEDLAQAAAPPQEPCLQLKHRDKTLLLNTQRPSLSLGREASNDVFVHDPRASRKHAKIERRREIFIYVDSSSNGSFITIEGEAEVLVKRAEMQLRGRGRISFGHSYRTDPSEFVEFAIED